MFEKSSSISKIRTLNYRDLMIFLVPVIVFSYYLHVYSPGIMVYDSFSQFHQIATGQFTNWHPFFHTFIEMICVNIYRSPASVAVLQIIVFSLIWMIMCKYNRDDSQKSNTLFLFQLVFTLIIALVPINAVYSINLQKDILFSYLVLLLCFLMQVLIDRKGHMGYPFAVLLSLSMACIAQLRQNGMILIIVFMLILAFLLFLKNRNEKWYLIIPALTIVFILLIASLNIVYNVEDHQNDALRDIVTHMLAEYDITLQIDSADQVKLDKLFKEKELKKHYQVFFKDPTRNFIINKEAWKNDKGAYVAMAIKYSLMHPKHFVKYMFESAPIVWKITRESEWHDANGVVYVTDMNGQRGSFYNKQNRTPVSDIDNASAVNVETAEYKSLNGFVNFAQDNLLFDTIFDSPALYMYLSIIILIVLYLVTRLKDLWLLYLPNLLNIGIVFVSIPAQMNRYLYPNLLVFYLLVIILAGVLVKKEIKNK